MNPVTNKIKIIPNIAIKLHDITVINFDFQIPLSDPITNISEIGDHYPKRQINRLKVTWTSVKNASKRSKF